MSEGASVLPALWLCGLLGQGNANLKQSVFNMYSTLIPIGILSYHYYNLNTTVSTQRTVFWCDLRKEFMLYHYTLLPTASLHNMRLVIAVTRHSLVHLNASLQFSRGSTSQKTNALLAIRRSEMSRSTLRHQLFTNDITSVGYVTSREVSASSNVTRFFLWRLQDAACNFATQNFHITFYHDNNSWELRYNFPNIAKHT
jgi:hypothetical protein